MKFNDDKFSEKKGSWFYGFRKRRLLFSGIVINLKLKIFLLFLVRRINLEKLKQSTRKLNIIFSNFRYSAFSKVKGRVFIDPFLPYYPGRYFNKLLSNGMVSTPPLKPFYAHISVTNRCPCNCFHCHSKDTTENEISKNKVIEVINEAAAFGFPMMIFVGGEPMSRFNDLKEFIKTASPHMDTRMFTSGVGSSKERLKELKKAGLSGINISIDHFDNEIHNKKRKNNRAFQSACKAVTDSVEAGLYVSVVCCVTVSMVRSGEFKKVVELAENLGAHSIQLNEIRPAGMALKSDAKELFITAIEKEILIEYYKKQNRSRRKISIVLPWYNEEPYRFGCMATSGQKVYIDAKGQVSPCELAAINIGDVNRESFKTIWERFLDKTSHPVSECIVHDLKKIHSAGKKLILDSKRKNLMWKKICSSEPSYVHRKLNNLPENLSCIDDILNKYDVHIREGDDFTIKRGHWFAKKMNAEYIAFGKTLYCSRKDALLPRHEFLHLVQFRHYGTISVIKHYISNLIKNYKESRDLKKSFRNIPFEIEARRFAGEKN